MNDARASQALSNELDKLNNDCSGIEDTITRIQAHINRDTSEYKRLWELTRWVNKKMDENADYYVCEEEDITYGDLEDMMDDEWNPRYDHIKDMDRLRKSIADNRKDVKIERAHLHTLETQKKLVERRIARSMRQAKYKVEWSLYNTRSVSN